MKVIKRNGIEVDYSIERIRSAVTKAFAEVYKKKLSAGKLNKIEKICKAADTEIRKPNEIHTEERIISVEEIQDIVERKISAVDFAVAKAYILYRTARALEREKKDRMFAKIEDVTKITSRENANVGNSPSAKLLQIAEVADTEYATRFLLPEKTVKAVEDNLIHIHDFSWYGVGTTTCTFSDLGKLLENGFNNGHGFIRSPKSIQTASALAAIIFQSNQNEQHGGQAFAAFDTDMAPYVRIEYEKCRKKVTDFIEKFGMSLSDEEIDNVAWEETSKATAQAMEALVHNLNTMHSRAGAQVPFTSINFGLDTTKEGRLISEKLLLAFENGLGNGEQPLFPILIFLVKKGINSNPEDPNFDLFQLSMRVTSKRLYPNYCFQDCTLNDGFPEPIPRMGCRTAVSRNINMPEDKQTCKGRGNLSFTTINLPGLALQVTEKRNMKSECSFDEIKSKYGINIEETPFNKAFFCKLYDTCELVKNQLIERFEYQAKFKKRDFPFLMNGNWIDSDKIGPDDEVREVIKHGTLGIGFIGLAETLILLCGKHHGEDSSAQKLGLEIVSFMNAYTRNATTEHRLNFAVLATPAEGLSGKFLEKDRAKYGKIKGVTAKDWYTNSFHVPVEYKTTAIHKIETEGVYHKYCSGGQISYIELKSAPDKNPQALYKLLKAMEANDMGYCAVNFPIDRCPSCGHTGLIDEDCPVCGCESRKISRIRRITGYLADLTMFNHAKYEEALHRTKHK